MLTPRVYERCVSRFLMSVVCVSLVLSSAWGVPKISLDDYGNFVDGNGMKYIFHGINYANKFNDTFLDIGEYGKLLPKYQTYGLNVIRFGVRWSKAMQNEGSVNNDYLDQVKRFVDRCAIRDIYVILEMHQDALSSLFGSYDTIPLWLVEKISHPSSEKAYPWPLKAKPTAWYENYKTYACVDCAEQLYTDWTIAIAAWGDFWAAMAQTFRSTDNVLGFELINDPPPANFYKSPYSKIPSHVGKNFLLPVYDYLVARIREFDSKTLIFYAPLSWGQYESPDFVGRDTGFDHVPGSLSDSTEKERSVLSYRYFCWMLREKDRHQPMTWMESETCDGWLMPEVFSKAADSVSRTGGGRFLTAFGFCAPDGNPKSANSVECERVMTMADDQLQSWTYAEDYLFDDKGLPIITYVRAFSRPYPMKLKGENVTYSFDPTNNHFHLQFDIKPVKTDDGTTITVAYIYFPASIHYVQGISVEVKPELLETAKLSTILQVNIPPKSTITKENNRVDILIKPEHKT